MRTRTKLFFITILLVFSVFSFTNTRLLVTKGDNVTVEYTGWINNHTFNTKVVNFKVGEEEVIPGLDSGVLGMRLGEEKNLTIPPAEAFGKYKLDLIYELKKQFFKTLNESIPPVGEVLTINGARGEVIAVTNETVIFDTNHELAGEEINMTIKLLNHIQGQS